MKTDLDKRNLIAELMSTRRDIMDVFRSLTPELQNTVFLGQWSPADLVAHLIGWDYTNVQAINEIRSRVLPSFYAQQDRDWKTYNAQLVSRYKSADPNTLLASAEQSHRTLIAVLDGLSAEQIVHDYGVRAGRYKVTIDRLLRVELSEEGEHLEQSKLSRHPFTQIKFIR